MSQKILNALKAANDKLGDVADNLAESKKGFYEALQAVGITNCTESDTFEYYAKLIKNNLSVSTGSPFILEISIPDTTDLTAYKKTVVLPMYFGVDGNSETTLNGIADEIIAAESEETSSAKASTTLMSEISGPVADSEEDLTVIPSEDDEENEGGLLPDTDEEDLLAEYKITDVYGNEIIDGDAEIPDEVWESLNPQVAEDDNDATYSARRARTVGASDEDTPTTADEWEQDGDATYSYYVDWGDGTDYCYYDPAKSYTANKSAIWHTYETEGVYDISIYGTYKRVYCCSSNTVYGTSSRTSNGSYVYDNDNVVLYDNYNYGLCKYLIEVISWGKTSFTNLQYGFMQCASLTSVPMYDTTSAFTDVTSCYETFCRCTSLNSLPFNENTNKGLFSDCENITTFYGCFYNCTGYTGSIPDKLCDGCSAVTTMYRMFCGCSNVTGSIPNGLFAGMSSLTTAGEAFSGCTKLDGEISEDMFADSPKITSIYRLFYNCQNITGKFKYGFIGKLSALTDMRQAFYQCYKLEGFALGSEDDTFDPDTDLHDGDTYDENKSYAFYDLTYSGINCRQAFYACTGITEIPEGLIESLTGLNNYLEKMFEGCTAITYISPTALADLHVRNARGMFGLGKSSSSSEMTVNFSDMTENGDWSTYEGMKRWFGVFANAGFPDDDDMPLELGGDGDRRFSDRHVGAIVLKDETLVDPKDYEYDSDNVPIGIVYADVYIDPDKSVVTLSSGSGNVVDDETDGAEHKLFCTVLNDSATYWTYDSSNVSTYGYEDITTITNTSDVNVGYNRYTWTESDGEYTAARQAVRYNGEAYYDAIMEWQISSGLIDDLSDITGTSSTKYRAANYVYRYQIYTDAEYGLCFLPDGADLWDQFVMRQLIYKACTAIINGGGSYTSSNCYPMRNGTDYWASAEYSSSYAWNCTTYYAFLNTNYNKYNSSYVRPSFALAL